jgi:hypothetical protein
MKVVISKTMTLPMLYGILSAWIAVGGLSVFILIKIASMPIVSALVAVSGILLLALVPALRRGAWVYTNARKHHSAEYFYELGNGAEVAVAAGNYEKKVRKAVGGWLKRKTLRSSFGVLPVSFFVFLLAGFNWYLSLLGVLFILLSTILAVYLGMAVMLLTARKLCYDRFGNIKNN